MDRLRKRKVQCPVSARVLRVWPSELPPLLRGALALFPGILRAYDDNSGLDKDDDNKKTHFLASLMVLSLLPVRSLHESLLLVFWLLILPPAARN